MPDNGATKDGGAAASIRDVVQLSQRRFDIRTLPADLQRVCKALAAKHGEEYALRVIFTILTAVELHRAWHMTLLTSKILQQLTERFRLPLTWNLGVFRLQFRIEDGGSEIFRKVPYDYDSEYQDIYMRIAIALMDGDITVHEALIYQAETKLGVHTAASGRFLRDFPGRLVLYPLVAATCAVIFFGGDWIDFGIAALTGFASGVVEWCLSLLGAGALTDVLVGTTTGAISGLFYRFHSDDLCLSSIFLGTLYWYFYGTAFVLGILEIISGELEVGVTRFIAVSVKTFVLSLGASFGLLVVGNAQKVWFEQSTNCNLINLDEHWWRIPLYLLCSVSVLGQYRFPVMRYWRALVVMLVAYEVQYELFNYFATIHDRDNSDTATSNVFGSAAAVVTASAVSYYVNQLRYYSAARLLQPEEDTSCIGGFIYHFTALGTRFGYMLRLGRTSDKLKLDLEKKLTHAKRELNDPMHARHEIKLEPAEENLIIETIVGAQDMNIWSILMPALYQLVPGSMIAKFWFNYIFPPPPTDEQANNVFASLMIISTSLALGLVVGFATVQVLETFFGSCSVFRDRLKSDEKTKRAQSRRKGMYSAPVTDEDDPHSVAEEFRKLIIHGASTEAEADKIFNVLDLDQSDSIDEGEVTYYMLKAGLTTEQIKKLFASMDKDGNGEVSRQEFRCAILNKANADLLEPQEDLQEVPQVDGTPEKAEVGGTVELGASMLSGEYSPTGGVVKKETP